MVTTVPDQPPLAFAWVQRGGVNVFLNSRGAATQDEGEFWKSPLKNQFYGMREFTIEDPDGYVLIFAQRTA